MLVGTVHLLPPPLLSSSLSLLSSLSITRRLPFRLRASCWLLRFRFVVPPAFVIVRLTAAARAFALVASSLWCGWEWEQAAKSWLCCEFTRASRSLLTPSRTSPASLPSLSSSVDAP